MYDAELRVGVLGSLDPTWKQAVSTVDADAKGLSQRVDESLKSGFSGKSAREAADVFAREFNRIEIAAGEFDRRTREALSNVFSESGKSAAASAAAFQDLLPEVSKYTKLTERAEEQHAKLVDAVEAGSPEMAQQWQRLMGLQIGMRREIESTRGSIENATEDEIKAYRKVEAQVAQTETNIREMNQEMQRRSAAVRSDFQGWGPLLVSQTSRFGTMGSAIAGLAGNFLLLGAAAKQAKFQLDLVSETSLGDEGKEWWKRAIDEATNAFRKRQTEVRREGYDQIVQAMLFFGSAVTGDDDFQKTMDASRRKTIKDWNYKPWTETFIGPMRPDDGQLLQSRAITSQRLRKEAEEERKKAEAAAEAARAIAQMTVARQAELDLLTITDPFLRAEREYRRDIALAAFEQTGALRNLAEAMAEVNRQQKIDAAFTSLWQNNRLAGMYASYNAREEQARVKRVQNRSDEIDDFFAGEEARNAFDDSRTQKQIEQWQTAWDDIGERFSDVLTDFAMTGGDNFGRIAAQRFGELTAKGFDSLFGSIFGGAISQGDDGQWYFGGSSTAYASEADAMAARTGRMQKAGAALDFGMIGVGAYGAARGADGTRTGSVISGAASGASIGSAIPALGTAWGAVIGAIVGVVGGYLGEKERQDQYKYGIPFIDSRGNASLGATKNILPAEREQIESRIQETYDSIRNAYAKIFIRAGVDTPDVGAINGQFQPKPSQNWQKHLDEWLAGTLPDWIAEKMKPELSSAFEGVGLEIDKFNELWKKFDKLDPKKAAALWGELYDAMSSIQESTQFFSRSNPWGENTSYFGNMMDIRKEMGRSTADVFTEDYFDPILKVAAGINDLVGEEQIHAISEIARMQKEAQEAQKAAIQEIIRISDAAVERRDSAIANIEVGRMLKPDGTPDYARQAEYFKGMADELLRKIDSAATAQEADKYYQQYIDIISKIPGMGYSISKETGDAWSQWAIDAITKGEGILQKQLDDLGVEISAANDAFMQRFGPIYESFSTAVSDVGADIGKVGEEIGDLIPDFRDLGAEIQSLTAILREFRPEAENFARFVQNSRAA